MFPRLQFLTLDGASHGHVAQARLALAGGVRWIQLRAKGLAEQEWTRLAREVGALCRAAGATFIVNDSPRVAAAAGADGVHLGAADASPEEARALLGERALVGVTLNFPAHLDRLRGARVDYVGVGPLRATSSKPGHAVPHAEASLRSLIAAAGLPAYVIGGVVAEDAPRLLGLGAHGLAVSAAIASAADPEAAARRLVAAVG
ncbi:MAG: thiamine phosphate synthase [Verrucomicrobiota bacterium]|nr:thiamine phosphate synthase [Verrucomicrobiota bacterium]